MSDPSFLVMRLGSLGDIVHAFPAVSGLRKSFQNSQIVWIAHPKWEFLVKTSGIATEVWTLDTRDWANLRHILKRIRAYRFSTAIDYQGLWKSAAVPFLSGVPRRIGFSAETVREAGVSILYTDRVKVTANRHIADQNGELSMRAGAFVPIGEVKLQMDGEDQRVVAARLASEGIDEYAVLSPGGGWKSKCWPAERFGQFAEEIWREFGIRSVINVGPGESELAVAVAHHAGTSSPVPFSGSLGQLMALLKNAQAVVAGDTGPLHLADALGTAVIAIFGPTDPLRNGPYRRSGVVLRWESAVTSYKRGAEPDPSLQHISVEEVVNAFRGLRRPA